MTPLPDAMVEAAARALYEDMWRYDEDDPTNDLGPWEELDGDGREGWRASTRLALAAALSVGEVREETGHWSARGSYVWACPGGNHSMGCLDGLDPPATHRRTVRTFSEGGWRVLEAELRAVGPTTRADGEWDDVVTRRPPAGKGGGLDVA